MTEEQKIEFQKLKNDYPDFFKKTPPELVDFILSGKTSEKIAGIAIKNGVSDEEKIEGIAERITLVLLNRLPSGNLAMTLELGLGLSPEIAKKIADEANQFISSAMTQPKKELPKEEVMVGQRPKRPSSKDVYREPVE